MISNWLECRIADLCDSIDYGYTTSAKELPVGPRFLRITDIVSGHIDWNVVPYCEIDEADIPGVRLHHGDIVIARTGATTGISAYISNPPNAIFASYLVRLKVGSNADSRFISYFLKSEGFRSYMGGVLGDKSAQPNASARTMTQVKLRNPPLSVQRSIASVLGTLDDKIESNRQMNETLADLTESLFKSWFVDYRNPCAKPGQFQNSPLGQIPKGWSIGKLTDIADVVMGLSPAGDSYNTNEVGVPLINGPVEFGEYFPVKSKWTTSPTRMAQTGDLIFCVRGSTTGRRVIADNAYCLGRGVCGIRARNGATDFLYQTVHLGLDTLLSKTTGSVFPSLSAPDIKNFPIVVPPWPTIERFGEVAEPLTKRLQANARECKTLAALRDALLPKLLSEEIRVAK